MFAWGSAEGRSTASEVGQSCQKDGGAKGILPHMGKLLNEYYEIRGWTHEGIPSSRN